MVNCLYRPAKSGAFPSFDLDKGDGAIPLDNQVNVAVSAPESPLDNPPAAPPKPPLRDPLSELTKCLPGR